MRPLTPASVAAGCVLRLTGAVEEAVQAGQFPGHVDPEGFLRCVLALIQGFVLQQA